MPLNERDFGRLEGKFDGLDSRVAALQRSNEDDHAAVIRALAALEERFGVIVDDHGKRIDSLESDRDKGSGASENRAKVFSRAWAVGIVAFSAAISILANAFLPH